jgi:hypothetical protein
MKYWADPKSSYETVTKDATKATAVDYLQFPEQTLTLKTGDCDDLSILESALLEAASVPTAFVTVPGHIYIAFQLKMSAAEAKKSFLKPDDLIFKYDAAWVPLEVTAIKDGFLKAWETGAKEWRESDTRGQAGFWRFGRQEEVCARRFLIRCVVAQPANRSRAGQGIHRRGEKVHQQGDRDAGVRHSSGDQEGRRQA